MNSIEKGNKNERKAVNIIKRVRGSGSVNKVNVYSNHDVFNIADIIAVGNERKILFVQVKTNNISKKEKERYKQLASLRLNFDCSIFELWIRRDYKGWEMYEVELIE